MLDPVLRRTKDAALGPLARALGPRLHPNAVSLLACAAGLAAAAAILAAAPLPALALWLFSRLLDGLDGALARAHGLQSDFGGYLDILLDFVVYAALPLAATWAADAGRAHWLALAVLLASFYVNAASWMYLAAVLEKRARGAAARGEPTTVTMPTGLIEGTETLVFFSLFILLPGVLAPLFWMLAALVALTVLQRLAWARTHL